MKITEGPFWAGRRLDNFSAIFDDDSLANRTRSGAQFLNLLEDSEADSHVGQLAEHHVFAIQMRRRHCRYKKLRPVCVGSCVGHWENPWSIVNQSELLVLELVPVDAVPSVSVSPLEVSPLGQGVVVSRSRVYQCLYGCSMYCQLSEWALQTSSSHSSPANTFTRKMLSWQETLDTLFLPGSWSPGWLGVLWSPCTRSLAPPCRAAGSSPSSSAPESRIVLSQSSPTPRHQQSAPSTLCFFSFCLKVFWRRLGICVTQQILN